MRNSQRPGVVKFCRQFAAALIVVTAMALVGVVIEHSPAAQTIAPNHNGGAQVIHRGGQAFAEIKTPQGEELRKLPTGFNGPGQSGGRGSGAPPDWQQWKHVLLIIVLIALIATVIGGLDRLRRSAGQVRQSA